MLDGVPRGALPTGDSAPHSAGREEEYGDTLTPLFVVDGRAISLKSADGSTLLRWLGRRRSITIVRAGNDTGYAGYQSNSSTKAVGVTMSTSLIDPISSRSASPVTRRTAPPSTAASRNMSWTDQGEKVTVAPRSEDDTGAPRGHISPPTMTLLRRPEARRLRRRLPGAHRTVPNYLQPGGHRRPQETSARADATALVGPRRARSRWHGIGSRFHGPPRATVEAATLEDRQRVARAVVEKAKLTVLVLRIGHRKHVYR